jgi:hypothetical protein
MSSFLTSLKLASTGNRDRGEAARADPLAALTSSHLETKGETKLAPAVEQKTDAKLSTASAAERQRFFEDGKPVLEV